MNARYLFFWRCLFLGAAWRFQLPLVQCKSCAHKHMLQPRRRMLLPWRCLYLGAALALPAASCWRCRILGAAFLLPYVYIQNMQNSCQNAASLGANLCADDSGESLLYCYLSYPRALALEVVVAVEQIDSAIFDFHD